MAKMSKDEYLDSLMPMWGRLNRRPDGFIVLRVYYDAVVCECDSADCRGWRLIPGVQKYDIEVPKDVVY